MVKDLNVIRNKKNKLTTQQQSCDVKRFYNHFNCERRTNSIALWENVNVKGSLLGKNFNPSVSMQQFKIKLLNIVLFAWFLINSLSNNMSLK